MLYSVKTYNELHGQKTSREDIENLLINAEAEEQSYIANKLKTMLKNNPDAAYFRIELSSPGIEQLPESLKGCFQCAQDHGITDDEYTDGLGKAVSPEDIHKMILQKMIDHIDKATGKGYVKKWKVKGYTIPFNFVSKKPYRGINYLMLAGFGGELLDNPFYLTFKQVTDLGGKVKKGAEGQEVIYYNFTYKYTQQDAGLDFKTNDRQKFIEWVKKNKSKIAPLNWDKPISLGNFIYNCQFAYLRYYNVFSGSDIEGIDFDLDNFKLGFIDNGIVGNNDEPIALAEAIVDNYPEPKVPIKRVSGAQRAFYSPVKDFIQLPEMKDFDTNQDYYRTLFHEMIHSTGSSKRLDRVFGRKMESPEYAKEELVAEFGSVFLNAQAGIMFFNNKNHAEYLAGWKNRLHYLKEDPKFLMKAASDAQKATDYILNLDEAGVPAYQKALAEKQKAEAAEKAKAKKEKPVATKKNPAKKPTPPKKKQPEQLELALHGIKDTKLRAEAKKIWEKAQAEGKSQMEALMQWLFDEKEQKPLNGSWHAKNSKFRHTTDEKQRLKPGYIYVKGGGIKNLKTGKVFTDEKQKKKALRPVKTKKDTFTYDDSYKSFDFTKIGKVTKAKIDKELANLEKLLKGQISPGAKKRMETDVERFENLQENLKEKSVPVKPKEPTTKVSRRNSRSKVYVGAIVEGKQGKGTISKIITKSTGYVEVTYENGKVAKEMAFNLKDENGEPLKKNPKSSTSGMTRGEKKRDKDRKSIERFNKLDNLQKIKETLLWINSVASGDRNSLTYKIWVEYLYHIRDKGKALGSEIVVDIATKADKYMSITEKQAYVLAKFADENGLVYGEKRLEEKGLGFAVTLPAQPVEPTPEPQPAETPTGVMSGADLMNMEFKTMQLTGEWANFMQEPEENVRLAIFGKPKNGKTAGSTALAKELSNHGNVLYVFADQGISASTKKLWQLAGLNEAKNVDLMATTDINQLDKVLATGKYKYVFLDMLNTFIDAAKITAHEFRERFYGKYPQIGYIFVMEATKSGDFKGAQAWMHLPDQIVEVENFVMKTHGRYGMGEYVVWKEGLQKMNPKKYKEIYGDEPEVPAEPEPTQPDNQEPVALPFSFTEY
ncbi:Antirestriction protein ArdC [Pustulibacterium marinum]|uniref:Antirestriction protein ArdC n=1 Tax=Pustulibacterium marinum TaxID=1224947 RepID=A0A1I7IVT7_9FLAO|nr:zincin-like metallopeptidase domain-containing protein [Pustulibacterium marinum]SFU77018.1 Antirestriction protein ArdC [Pustulibacterium marinum]